MNITRLDTVPSLVIGAMVGYTAPGNQIFMHDHYMHINCTRSGSPSVIMDSGLGGTSLDWRAHSTAGCALHSHLRV